jgi:LysM repeat protein
MGKWSQKSGLRHRPQISEKLISYIERYDLGRYDAIVMGKTILHLKSKTQESLLLTVRIDPMRCKGDTLYSISKKYNLLVNELKQINNLSANTISIGQRLIVK